MIIAMNSMLFVRLHRSHALQLDCERNGYTFYTGNDCLQQHQ